MLKAKSVTRVASWPQPGALYAGQVRTISVQVGDSAARTVVEEMITQGGQGDDPLRGDPLTRWDRHPGVNRQFGFVDHVIAADPFFPLAFPFLQVPLRGLQQRIGATGAGTWYQRLSGLYEAWVCPSVGSSPTVAGGYEREFVLYHLLSDNRRDWWSVDYNRNTTNLALRRAALRMTNDIVSADKYPAAHGIGGGGGFVTVESEWLSATVRSRALYLMLKCFYDDDPAGVAQQKNVLVRKYIDIRGAEFEAWTARRDPDLKWIWQECADGLIPAELFTHGFAPHPWPIDSIYETPIGWRDWPRRFNLRLGDAPFTAVPQFMGVVGQPVEPQLALVFSENMIDWSSPLSIDLGPEWAGVEINYRTCDATGSGNFLFGSNRDAVDPKNPTSNMAQWEVVLETL